MLYPAELPNHIFGLQI